MVENCKEIIIKKYFLLNKLSTSAETKGLLQEADEGTFCWPIISYVLNSYSFIQKAN